jgi:hypothetical protein
MVLISASMAVALGDAPPSGSLWHCGWNTFGDATLRDAAEPRLPVGPAPLPDDAVAIAAGLQHALVVSSAVSHCSVACCDAARCRNACCV